MVGLLLMTATEPIMQDSAVTLEDLAVTIAELKASISETASGPLTVEQAAKFLGVSTSTIYHWTASGEIPHYKPNGKRCYFLREELLDWVKRNRIAGRDELERVAATHIVRGE